jgi:hypothetical protein
MLPMRQHRLSRRAEQYANAPVLPQARVKNIRQQIIPAHALSDSLNTSTHLLPVKFPVIGKDHTII